METICTELQAILLVPSPEPEPEECMISKLRMMDPDERAQTLRAMSIQEQMKLAYTHKICSLIRGDNHRCLLAE
jgi:aspartate carbamoyltransferase regulatory subunit